MSGSEKYVVVWLKSRGGFEMTVGGVARCASTESPTSAAPATAPIAFTMPRREIWCVFMDAYFSLKCPLLKAQCTMLNGENR